MRIAGICLAIGLAPALFAQCEPRLEVRQVLARQLDPAQLREMKFTERAAFRRQVLEELIAKYPREVEPYRILIATTKNEETGRYPALADQFRKQAAEHPDDPLMLYVAGLALGGRNTPRGIELLERARSLQPDFPWPALALAYIYGPGTKLVDAHKSDQELTAFFAACPASTDADAQRLLARTGSPVLQARVAAALRTRLAGEQDPKRLLDYATLWGLEFRVHPPAEHDAVRRQVAADLKRLEPLNAEPDAAWLVFLKDAYKQSGAPRETITAMEDRVMQAFPQSGEAFRIVRERWRTAHKEPDDQKDAAAWARYRNLYRPVLKEWMARFSGLHQLHQAWFYEVADDPDLSVEEGLRALEDFLAEDAYQPPNMGTFLWAAEFLNDHHWQPQRVFELLRNSGELMDAWDIRLLGDNLSAGSEDIWKSNDIILRQEAAGAVLVAARRAGEPEQAARFKAFIERDLPAKSWPSIESNYWQNRGRLAWLEGRKADALAYYQKALQARKKPPEPYQGRLTDDLMDEARALWVQLGGSQTAWAVWSKPPAAKIQEAAEIGWKKPDRDMPAFELADLSGKTWRLKDLAGRAVLINVWATWCGPCQEELPMLEKLYEKVKDRGDLQILTLTIDEDLGAVAPFMKEKGYTFPVLPAQTFVTGLLDNVSIPQNWILDPKGVWRWTGQAAGSGAEWEAAMLKQLEAAR